MKTLLGILVILIMGRIISGLPHPPAIESALVDPLADTGNEDIDDPPLSWHEAHCAPVWYHPPDHLVPDKWHPAQNLKNLKP